MSEDEKAICFCGKTSFSGLLRLEGIVTRSAAGDGFGCGAAAGTGFLGAALNEPSAVAGRASSEFAGGRGVGAVVAGDFSMGGAGLLGVAPNELRTIAEFLGLGLAVGGDAAAATDFLESKLGFPAPVPFGPTAPAR